MLAVEDRQEGADRILHGKQSGGLDDEAGYARRSPERDGDGTQTTA